MSRNPSPSSKTRPARRRKKVQSPALVPGRQRRPRRNAAHSAATRRQGRARYDYAVSGLLPRLRQQGAYLNPSRAIALFLLAVTVALLFWFFVDESFYVYAAEVQGNSLVTADEVYRAANLDTVSIFYINRQRAARDIERAIPGVAQARVHLQLPDRVSVLIREQDVRYLWRTADTVLLADGEGRILKVDDGTHAGLLVIQDLDNQPLRPGDQVDRVTLNTVGRLHSLLPEVQVFEYSKARGVSISDARGWRVYFGDDERLAEKVATLQALLLKLMQEHKSVQVIDLRFIDSPYYQ